MFDLAWVFANLKREGSQSSNTAKRDGGREPGLETANHHEIFVTTDSTKTSDQNPFAPMTYIFTRFLFERTDCQARNTTSPMPVYFETAHNKAEFLKLRKKTIKPYRKGNR